MKEQRQHKVSVDHGKTKSETWRRRRGRAFATQAELSLSFSSGEQPLHKLLRLFVLSKTFALDSSTIFYKCNFFLHIFLYKCLFSTFVITKNTTCLTNAFFLKKKTSYTMSVHDVWPELLLWIYCFVHWVMFGATCTLKVQYAGTSLLMVCTTLKMFDFQLKPSSAFHLW